MCQNSGLGNTINPLTSLNWPFRIPTLLIVTWRGQPGLRDEPQHDLMGRITAALLDTAEVRHLACPKNDGDIGPALEAAGAAMAGTGLPFALILEKDTVAEAALEQPPAKARPRGKLVDHRRGGTLATRVAALERILAVLPDAAAVIATTGKCGRELFTLADRPQHFYQVGSMGGASAMGLGVALNVRRPVIVLDGDGAALMKLGNLATIGAQAPDNLVHVVLDNGVHDSTGGQATVSASVDFAAVAMACGYAGAAACDDVAGLEAALRAALVAPGPHLLHLRIAPGSMAKLGRPTVGPAEVARRFREFVRSETGVSA
jgi:phosphonopyruvate decarboxylase